MSIGFEKELAKLALIAVISFAYTAYFGFYLPTTIVFGVINVIISTLTIDWIWSRFSNKVDLQEKPKRKRKNGE